MLALLVMSAQQFSGINCVLLSAANLVPTKEYMNSLTLLALIQFLVTALAVPFLDLAGRRKLLILSTVVCSGSLVTLGLVYNPSFPTATNGVETTTMDVSKSVIPVTTASTADQSGAASFAVQAFLVAGYSAGLGPVPWILAVELTPLRGAGMELGSVYAVSWASFFVTANFFSTSSTMQWLVITLWVYSCLTFHLRFLVSGPAAGDCACVHRGRAALGSRRKDDTTTRGKITGAGVKARHGTRASTRTAADRRRRRGTVLAFDQSSALKGATTAVAGYRQLVRNVPGIREVEV
ncbi:hypothetical protein MTO96_017809 [Rhipicephalus appendiculatus]